MKGTKIMKEIKVRKYEEKDIEAMYQLSIELAEHEEATEEQFTNSVERMKKEQGFFECFVAEDLHTGALLGMAVYFFAYYTWVGKSLYLDDLIVSKSHRGKGIGKKLLKKIIKEAKKNGCQRIRWQVLDSNEIATNLYKQIGSKIDKSWWNCDMDVSRINKYLKANTDID